MALCHVCLTLIFARIATDVGASWFPNLGHRIGGHVNLLGIYDQGAWSFPPQALCVCAVFPRRCDESDARIQSFAPLSPGGSGEGSCQPSSRTIGLTNGVDVNITVLWEIYLSPPPGYLHVSSS